MSTFSAKGNRKAIQKLTIYEKLDNILLINVKEVQRDEDV
jgi:hypothetical protein